MFRKGLYTQGVAILLQEKLDLGDLENLLHRFAPVKTREAAADWALSGTSLFLPYRPDINGYVAVDLVDRLWPDEMTDAVLPAWLLGHFGPFTYPGNLQRAVQHSYHWPDAAEAVAAHQAFLRIRLSYVFGASGDSPTIPKGCRPRHELEFVMRLVMALLEHPSALCYFNPGGEILATGSAMVSALDHYRQVDRPPIEWLANRRMFRIDGSDWILMDTVGLGQLDLPDLEICFPRSKYDPNDIARTLVNTALYLAQAGAEIKSGETIDGPGGKSRFWAKAFEESKIEPLRSTLRFRPDDGSVPPSELGFALPKKKAWQFWKR